MYIIWMISIYFSRWLRDTINVKTLLHEIM